MSATPHLYSAVFALIFNEKWEVLLNKRQNTWYYDGGRTLISWHVEVWEMASDALIREVKEECWLTVQKEDIQVHSRIHKIWNREYIDISFNIAHREWKISITEPERCTALERFSPEKLPDYMPEENKKFVEFAVKNTPCYYELDARSH